MSEENFIKRKVDFGESIDNKKLKSTSLDSVNEDLNYLKNAIRIEIFNEFEERFKKLEEQIELLKTNHSANKNPISDSDFLATQKDQHSENKTNNFETETNLNCTSELATPHNSFTATAVQTPKDSTTQSTTPKHVFGSTTSFGSKSVLEGFKNRKNVFDAMPKKDDSTKVKTQDNEPVKATTAPSFGSSSFGSNSKFGDAFKNSLSKKSFLDDENKDESEKDNDKSISSQQYKQVDLHPIEDIKTGEENELSLFSTTSKIFELSLRSISDGWKERGVGPLHLNQSNKDPTLVRLVMRSQGLLRVVLNMKITSDTKLLKGLEASLSPGKYLRLNSVNIEGEPIQYLLKFSNSGIRDELIEKIEALQDIIKKKESDKKKSEM